MTTRKLAEEVLAIPDWWKFDERIQRERRLAEAVIAQADLLEKLIPYAKTTLQRHDEMKKWAGINSDCRCSACRFVRDLCRDYDKLQESE